MNLLNLLQETHNQFLDSVMRMQRNGKPLVLFGAGCLGQMTWEFLTRQNITLSYVALNHQYVTAGQTFNGLPVVAIEDLAEGAERYNFIVALQFISEDIQQQFARVGEEVLIFDPSFIGVNTSDYYTREYCARHEARFNALYNELADNKSRETLVAFLNQRICATRGYYQAVYDEHHYFPRDLFRLQDNEVFVDCGAYNGDSIQAFMHEVEREQVSPPQRIIGYEPDSANYAALVENTRHMAYCECLNKGVWNEESVLYFQSGKALSSRVSEEAEAGTSITLSSIDATLQGKVATFIKMDVEGAELKALEGAANTIKTHQPILAISVYHKPEDLITIPQYIKSLRPDYTFYLRAHHPELAFELVLYALPADRVLI